MEKRNLVVYGNKAFEAEIRDAAKLKFINDNMKLGNQVIYLGIHKN